MSFQSHNGSMSAEGCLFFILVPLGAAIVSAFLETLGEVLDRRAERRRREGK